LEYLSQNVAEYEGDSGKYSVNTNVLNFQKALKMLGYNLGSFGSNKDGVDGKFGPQTQKALKDFQTQNALDSSLGRMDRVTAKKLSEVLKTKNIDGSEEIQNFLSSL
jgi:peptidoglycan hydrolase-like protein with peptidoglycan-binding domain